MYFYFNLIKRAQKTKTNFFSLDLFLRILTGFYIAKIVDDYNRRKQAFTEKFSSEKTSNSTNQINYFGILE